jgi:hypothetical protein
MPTAAWFEAIAVEQPQGFIQPLPTPPLPTEALTAANGARSLPYRVPIISECGIGRPKSLPDLGNRSLDDDRDPTRLDQSADQVHLSASAYTTQLLPESVVRISFG